MFERIKQKVLAHQEGAREESREDQLRDQPSGGSHSSPPHKTCVYFSNWSVYQRKHFPIDIPVHSVSHIFYAFIGIDPTTGSLKFTDEWCDLQMPMPSPKHPGRQVKGCLQQLYELKQLNRHLKVVMSVGGYGTAHLFQAVVADGNKLHEFVRSAVGMATEYGFDGIDIDWEFPSSNHEGQMLARMLQLLRQGLNAVSQRLLLTVATPGDSDNLAVLDLPQIDQYLSFWNVMCYDFVGQSWSSKTAYHSNLFGHNGDNSLSTSSIIDRYISRGVPATKLVMGMPMYGRVFHHVSAGEIGQPFIKVDGEGVDISDYKNLPIGTEHFDHKKVSAYCYDLASRKFITYDNVTSARIKATYAQNKGLAGGMWWDSAGDATGERSLLLAYVDQIGTHQLDKSQNNLDLYENSKYLGFD